MQTEPLYLNVSDPQILEMSELFSDYVNYTQIRGERIEKVVEIYDSADAASGEDVLDETEATNVQKSVPTVHTGYTAWSRSYRLTAVCVLLLCVLLLIAITVLWVKYSNLNTEDRQLQTKYNTLTLERDQYQQEISEMNGLIGKLGWTFFSSSVYCKCTKKKTWNESRQECQRKGADLVIINSTAEQEFIGKYFGGTEFWIGLTDSDREGEFKWVDGTPLTTEFWWIREPNDYGQREDCVVTGFRNAMNNMSTWADVPCNYHAFGICEMKLLDGRHEGQKN
ncbi:C-type lectin domain family 17, member A-like [Silurus meridionalis]|uniref:C-type lectin domain-containing protein n=1 Tax=Silurus meridionalis TaxID=175797 RepID=A0A8T0A6C1_SILME|nr:C-type lectin domain family 17, member A-like [Silurus meridionalis]KAF7686740.1 hypothetical protein HF521_015133 [Silurus meridionalis]